MAPASSPRAREDAASGSGVSGLLTAVASGDRAAFERLYDETAPRVHGLVLRVLADPAQAEEVTQEVFLEIWRTAPRFEAARGSAFGWLLTIAHRRAVDRVRSSAAARTRDVTYERQASAGPYDSTAETVTALLDAEQVRGALARLTDHQREAVEMAYFGGRTHTEIAETLGIPLGTAKSRIRDGLRRLRDHIGGER
ncbi:ECF RNA polymerase sigma factor SigK [Luteipulveratus sp. YIM 133132]|uniref:ECF RNA polymerase sigma factor SigK n=1 Tax=Luteipulveratus flavus TaxID=3031728 RepID=A0ABT6CAL8_9MICO|nr:MULTISPECIES: ECF RNA polymerase sigma factor SigK [unclassified Luteipulveratus]MDE9365321.1 ECF RNA polymerase sigma factor SigK [Luteipulveratus sp. YIM 133132]MDF8264341.1 ECF RNA polymerase sigma factor SigK [Luteipulveratus sp. YIM 133296]